MKSINVPARDQVSTESQLLFDQLTQRLGKVPNLYATIGYSPNALKGFLEYEATLNKGVFTPKEREAIALVVSEVNGCAYCLAAHTGLALRTGFTKEETISIRKGQVSDNKLNAIIQLGKSIAENKGKPGNDLLENFYQAGFNEAAVMELIGLIAVRVYTNYVFALTEVPLDFPPAEPLN
ncbi:putative peroxidase-related enzyme [Chitinophaga niastensis]|uniref:Putative peroxidase-related enzyme n=1 Tax=Chitinophaga niastensis TaxID=536980 RepID=A0A2P8HIV8_CHINA|nr:carboxymuconolactone decarboxylase family protein [Chitinophaga niastensis]PSL46142.1 putative peroxidase-related enzyme [Chitinophaga niastensis]